MVVEKTLGRSSVPHWFLTKHKMHNKHNTVVTRGDAGLLIASESLDTQWIIFQITYDMNIYFRKLMVDYYLEITHLDRTAINKCG